MFDHPIKVAFVVDDVSEAIRFYTGILDLRVQARFPSSAGPGEDFVFLKSESIYIELLPQKAMGGAPVGFHHLAFLVDSVDERLDQLRQRGATVTAEAFDGGVGGIRLGDFAGPGGVLLRLFTNGKLRSAAPGERVSMSDLVESGAALKRIATGFRFTEGPVWHGADRCFYFNDIPAATTYRCSLAGQIETVRTANGKANGMFVDHDGGLLACQHAKRRVVKFHRDGTEQVVTDQVDGMRYNSPNDIVVRSDGSVFFTDPPYGLTKEFGESGVPELPYFGVFHLNPDRTTARCVSTSFFRPNGLCLSPDESTLYVNDSEHLLIRAYDVAPDGTLTGERLFAEVRGEGSGVPDGMKTDSRGNVWVTGPGGLWIFDPHGAKVGVVAVPETAVNFCFGGDDAKTLFIAASTSVYRQRIGIAGA